MKQIYAMKPSWKKNKFRFRFFDGKSHSQLFDLNLIININEIISGNFWLYQII